ncbi:glycosyltransferase family 2 protein [Sulfurimonas sp. HSL-1716]|uniref:glycosyltransferase family 2 protein n=1 Tax=Hydrocurvibacter sulfurireducens TaxID=3131937 RepID=UPI0031F8D569
MNNAQKITVITITYNAEKYLEKTIQSVINQDYAHIEYIIIDGKSSDGTVDIIKKYEKNISYWISEADGGIYYAMNKGIEVATGSWVNFMNAGDTFASSNTISSIFNHDLSDYDVICGGVNIIENDEIIFYEPAQSLDVMEKRFPCNHQSMFTRIDPLKRYKFNTTYKIASDADLMMKLYYNGHKFKFIDIPIANYLKEGFWDENYVKAYAELTYIVSTYKEDQNDIYKHTAYKGLIKFDNNPNRYFADLVNRLIQEVDSFRNSSIALYGDGNITKFILPFLNRSVKVIFDISIDNRIEGEIIKDNPKNIHNYDFEKIVVTVLGREEEIIKYLVEQLHVNRSKIVAFDLSYKGN